jgi:hypothetical protein
MERIMIEKEKDTNDDQNGWKKATEFMKIEEKTKGIEKKE